MLSTAQDLARQRAHLVSDEIREGLIGRVAVLSQYVDRLLVVLKQKGIRAPAEPKLDDVRPAILAEGVTLRMKLQDAELKLADEEIKQLQREKADLRRQVEALGRAPAAPAPHQCETAIDRIRAEARGAPAVVGGGASGFVPLTAADIAPARCQRCDAELGEDTDSEDVFCREGTELEPTDATPAPVEDAPPAPVEDDEHDKPGNQRKRKAGGWVVAVLARLGRDATTSEIADADKRTTAATNQALSLAIRQGQVERCGKKGREGVYRLAKR